MLFPAFMAGRSRVPGCEKLVINHIDGCKTRNYVGFPGLENPDNLEWCDMSYNIKEAHRLGLKKAKFGEDHPNSVMTEEIVRHVCELIVAGGYTPKQISEITGVSIANYENIKYKRTWRHISKEYF